MRWPPKKVIMAIVVIAIILLIWSGRSMRAESTEYLVDRLWIDRVTDEPREMVESLLLIEDTDLGLTGRFSRYRINLDFARWSIEGDRLTLHLLQEDRRISYQAKTWRCQPGESPNEDLEYCLSLTGPNGTRKYFASDREESGFASFLESRHP